MTKSINPSIIIIVIINNILLLYNTEERCGVYLCKCYEFRLNDVSQLKITIKAQDSSICNYETTVYPVLIRGKTIFISDSLALCNKIYQEVFCILIIDTIQTSTADRHTDINSFLFFFNL